MLVTLALRSGIPVRFWRENLRDAFTAIELYQDEDRKARQGGGPVMSG